MKVSTNVPNRYKRISSFISQNTGRILNATLKRRIKLAAASTVASALAVGIMTGCSSATSSSSTESAATEAATVAVSESSTTAGAAETSAAPETVTVSETTTASPGDTSAADEGSAASAKENAASETSDEIIPLAHEIPSWFEATDSMDLIYAQEFSVDYDAEGRAYICIGTDEHFLLLPEGTQAPEGISDDVIVINGPLKSIYAASTSTLDLFDKCGAIGQVALVGTEYKNWTIQSVKDAMDSGTIKYAGKYSEPDFELIATSDIDFVIQNSDILHSVSTLEKLQEMGYDVMIERTSAESHPLGRAEWVRLMGLLTGHEEEAEKAFDDLKTQFDANIVNEKSDKTLAYFYINSSGQASVRLPSNYIIKTILLAGGNYAFDDVESEGTEVASVKMEPEAFYETARDADILIYNNNKDKSVTDIASLIAKNSLLADCKAVKEGNVWCTGANVYQQVTAVPGLLEDFRAIISGEADGKDDLNYLTRLK